MSRVDTTRRRLLAAVLGSAVIRRGVGSVAAQTAAPPAGELPHVNEKDKFAVNLAYVADASRVDKVKYPKFEAGQTCANCNLLDAKATGTWRPCRIFPGKTVNVAGWCKFWVKKPADAAKSAR